MWAKTDNQADIFWNQHQSWLTDEFPNTLPQPWDNWRLPTVSELQSLYVENSKYPGYQTDCGYQAKIVPQIRLSCILVWTSDSALGRRPMLKSVEKCETPILDVKIWDPQFSTFGPNETLIGISSPAPWRRGSNP